MHQQSPANTYADLSRSPLPTRATLRRRRNPLIQFVRFVVFSVSIMRMVLKGHQ